MKRYIVTGAPSTGKTTLINALKQEGFLVHNEISRQVIMQQQQQNGSKTPWQDIIGFSRLVTAQTLLELNNKISNTTFVDRGLADIIAYLKFYNNTSTHFLRNFPYKQYYHTTVFMLPTWQAIYQQDLQRLQSFEDALALEELLYKTYTKIGFSVIILPKTTVSNRVEFIKKHIS